MIDEKSKQIACYLKESFSGTPEVQRYLATDNVRYVDIIKTSHSDDVTYIGTIGGFRRPMKGQPIGKTKIRVEFLTAVKKQYTEIMAQTLGFLTFCLDTEMLYYHPGMVVENAIPDTNLTSMRHIFLCDPFLWKNGLKGIKMDDYVVAFLYALPITDSEKDYCLKHGSEALENIFQEKNISYFELNRLPSI